MPSDDLLRSCNSFFIIEREKEDLHKFLWARCQKKLKWFTPVPYFNGHLDTTNNYDGPEFNLWPLQRSSSVLPACSVAGGWSGPVRSSTRSHSLSVRSPWYTINNTSGGRLLWIWRQKRPFLPSSETMSDDDDDNNNDDPGNIYSLVNENLRLC